MYNMVYLKTLDPQHVAHSSPWKLLSPKKHFKLATCDNVTILRDETGHNKRAKGKLDEVGLSIKMFWGPIGN